ncbi:MAG: SDR family oxidoreductase [Candidatus Omnitrophota bacterium]
MAKYLVTGGAGFIGSNIAEELVKRGEFVRVLDNLITGKQENIEPFMRKIEFIKGDIRDLECVKKAVHEIDFVIHQAALGSVARSVEDPVSTNDVNVNGTLNILSCSKEAGVKRVVYASSSSVYGDCDTFPQKETFTPNPISPYAVSKIAGEYYCRVFSGTMDLETVSLRYFNVFGPRQDPGSIYSAVIPIFTSKLLNNEPCAIHGDGMQSRDFTYVYNVVDANIRACEAPDVSGLVCNVACGDEHPIVEVADEISRILGKDIKSVFGPVRSGDIRRSFADIGVLKDKLNIQKQIDFHTGLEKTVKWFMVNGYSVDS